MNRHGLAGGDAQAFLELYSPKAFNSYGDKSLSSKIHFQYLPEISYKNMTAKYDTAGGEAIGRSEAFSYYNSSSMESLTLDATFVADGYEDKHTTDRSKIRDAGWVQYQAHRLLALTRPIYDREDFIGGKAGVYSPPPTVFLTYGLQWIYTPILVTGVSLSVPDGAMIESIESTLPQIVKVKISFTTAYPYGNVPGYVNIHRAYKELSSSTSAGRTVWRGQNSISKNLSFSPKKVG